MAAAHARPVACHADAFVTLSNNTVTSLSRLDITVPMKCFRDAFTHERFRAMKGTPCAASAAGRGISNGRFGFEVAAVGSGGRDRISGVRPGMSNVITR